MAIAPTSAGTALNDSIGTAPPWLRQMQSSVAGYQPPGAISPAPNTMAAAGDGAPSPSGISPPIVAGIYPNGTSGVRMGSGDGVTRGIATPYGGGAAVQTSGVNLNDPSLTPMNTDFGAQEQRAGDAAYRGATQFMDEDFGRDRNALESQLINQGFAPGSQGFNDQMSRLQRGQDQARTSAALSAVGVGNQEAGNLFLRALQARQQQVGERGNEADREFGQSLGIANLGLGARGQDIGLQSAATGAAASTHAADLANDLGMRRLGLDANNQDFQQMMSLLGGSRGGVNMPNFGNPAPIDVTGAGSLANQSTQIGNQATAARNAGLYGLGAAAIGALGNYLGRP